MSPSESALLAGGGTLARSGTRLKASVYRGPQGFERFFGLTDSQLGVGCSFGTVASGELRCLPGGTEQYIAGEKQRFGTKEYTDAACSSQPVVRFGAQQPAMAAGDYVTVYENDGQHSDLNQGARIVALVPGTPMLYQRFGTQCQPSGDNFDDVTYSLTPVPASAFVEGSVQHVSIGGTRIFADVLAGVDGSRTGVTSYFDAQLGARVVAVPKQDRSTNDKTMIWVPDGPYEPGLSYAGGDRTFRFSDSTCSTPTVAIFDFGWFPAPGPDAVVAGPEVLTGACTYSVPYRKISTTPAPQLFDSYSGTCYPRSGDTGFRYFPLGGTASLNKYAKGTLSLRGAGRLASRAIVSEDGSLAIEAALHADAYDRVLESTCVMNIDGPGSASCIPQPLWSGATPVEDVSTLGYSDPLCKNEVIVAGGIGSERCYEGNVQVVYNVWPYTESTRIVGKRRIGHHRIKTYELVGGECRLNPVKSFAYVIRSTVTRPNATLTIVAK